MIEIEKAIKLFNKYGFNAKDSHPYLYIKNKELGAMYAINDNKYGFIERIVSFRYDTDLDKFLKRLSWFKKNAKKYNVQMKLNNYEVKSPNLLYIRNNHVMTDEEMFNIEDYDKMQAKKEKMSKNKLLVMEADNLFTIYINKKNEILKYIKTYNDKKEELKRYYLELQKLVNQYNREKMDIELDYNAPTINIDDDREDRVEICLAKSKSEKMKDNDIKELIYTIWDMNRCLEINNEYINDQKDNGNLDEAMRLVVTKIDFMKELLAKKRHWFSAVVNLKKKFIAIDESSTYENIYDDTFKDKIVNFVNKKYDVLKRVDILKLSTYLDNFATNNDYDIEKNISRSEEVYKKKNDDITFKEQEKKLTKQFNANLSIKEQNSIILYGNIYHELYNMIMNIKDFDILPIEELIGLLKITDGFNELINDSYDRIKKYLDDEDNREVKNNLFKNIDFTSIESFIDSIRSLIKDMKCINKKIVIKDQVRMFMAVDNINELGSNKFLELSPEISTYYKKKNKEYRILCAKLAKDTPVIFAPKTIKINMGKIQVINEPVNKLVIDLDDVVINDLCQAFYVSKYKTNLNENDDYNYVSEFELDYKDLVSKVEIEKKEKK